MRSRTHLADHIIGSPEFLEDPYPAYRRLREEAPVAWSDMWGGWVVSRYADVESVLRNVPVFSNVDRFNSLLDDLPAEDDSELTPLREHLRLGLANADPPEHSRLRGLLAKAFQPRSIDPLRPRVQAIVDSLYDGVADAGELDVPRDLAFPLPAIVIAELVGVPPSDRSRFKAWVDATTFHSSTDYSPSAVLEQARAASAAVVALAGWLRPMIEERRRTRSADLLGALVAAETAGEILTDAELVTMTIVLVRAGHVTTEGLIGNMLLALLRHPEQLRLLIDRPELIALAVEESLRYDAPFLRTMRRVTTDTSLGGIPMRPGERVWLLLGSANRDPAFLPDGERFDITRAPARHLSFGIGIHFCVGAPLARLEAQVAVSTLLARWPRLRLGPREPQHVRNDLMRHLDSMHVVLHP